jgi:hypothetical protein
MQILQAQLLALKNVARLWAAELRGTPLEEEHPGAIQRRLFEAFALGKLSAAAPAATKLLQKEAWWLLMSTQGLDDSFPNEDDPSDPYGARRGEQIVTEVKLSRAEFLRWVQEQGYPRPTFWDGSEPSVTAATTTEPRGAKLKVLKNPSVPAEPNQRSAVKAPAIPIVTGERLKRQAPGRDRVKAEMRAKVEAGEVTIDDFRRQKESWGKEFKCSPTTAYEAARELEKELKQKK